MKNDSIKNKLIMGTGILAGIFVLTLMVLSPNQNAAALSVSDEVHRRMTEAALEAEDYSAAFNGIAADDENQSDEEMNEGYLLGNGEAHQFFQQYWTASDADQSFRKLKPMVTMTLSGVATVNEVAVDESASETNARSMEYSSTENESSNLDSPLSQNLNNDENLDANFDQETSSFITDDDRFYGNERDFRLIENPPAVSTPTQTSIPLPTQQPTSVPTSIPTHAPTLEPTKLPTQTSVTTQTPKPTLQPTQEPTVEPTSIPTQVPTIVPTDVPAPEPTESPNLFWSAGFETGDISEWTAHGDWLRQGNTATYAIQKQQAHSGEYAVKFTIDTSSGSSQAAYLFYWDTLPNAAYYSAWYYIPGNIDTEVWWNIMQWKSTYNGNTDYSRPMFVLDGALFGQTALSLCYLPDRDEDKHCWKQTEVALPQDQWVHIEVYYERDKVDGHVIVWQDGEKLFDVTGYPTVLSDGTLYYSVNHYTDGISPDVSSIYIDDVAISYDRIGQ